MTFLEGKMLPNKAQRATDAAITRLLNEKIRKDTQMSRSLNNFIDFSKLYSDYIEAKILKNRKIDVNLMKRYMKRRGIWEKVVLFDEKKLKIQQNF